jgi:hypothetical protein
MPEYREDEFDLSSLHVVASVREMHLSRCSVPVHIAQAHDHCENG